MHCFICGQLMINLKGISKCRILQNNAINYDHFEKYQLFMKEFQKYINVPKFEYETNVIDSNRKIDFKCAFDLFKLLI